MSSTVATTGDPIIQVHKSVGEGARAAASSLPTVASAGMRPSHAGILENALGETRRTLTELGRVADVGAGGAGALADQDSENARRFGGWDAPELERRGEPHGETRVV
ncbi:Uncharacterised protein [Mycobacteroides abscessus subsp. abscessus]|uniref:hypothetical protein n=1 Tax=Mycobacteroides abscessus TaxID=36809 RepID=UPI0005DEB6CF|nr:hypothetical protein [Mycobacteroides abscessus]MBN7556744.1 hypothetical protein [Mycobacteroides abscessus subsp. abscessus]MDO3011350.1 hypothetical protein [Mycobacteroides abscessus subsp. abscessus]MDO3046591.1 hypothetical protein [Mycobacteroides abscessus subsp. abscessus]MDO3137394.1 hypothetical protein [Mycobacteroides abscessus subsp. abscessus]MDO3155077.1 hypothetical protein [Mycobacteroides abscessus subsp. abscessus]